MKAMARRLRSILTPNFIGFFEGALSMLVKNLPPPTFLCVSHGKFTSFF